MGLFNKFHAWTLGLLLNGHFENPEKLFMLAEPEVYTNLDRFKDFQAVFSTQQGQRVLKQILRWTHMWQSSMSEDSHAVVFAEGERNVGLKILAALCYREKPTKQANRLSKEASNE